MVSFVKFGSKIFNTEFYTWPCTSQRHQRSAVATCTQGCNWQRPCQAELVNVMIARSECLRRKSWTTEKYFSLNLTYLVAFHRLNRHFGPTSGVRNSHFSGGRNFKNALRTFESANWRDWNCVSSISRWSLLSGGRKDRFDCTLFLPTRQESWRCTRKYPQFFLSIDLSRFFLSIKLSELSKCKSRIAGCSLS